MKRAGAFFGAGQLERTRGKSDALSRAADDLASQARECLAVIGEPVDRLNLNLYDLGLQTPVDAMDLKAASTAFRRMADNMDAYADWALYRRSINDIRATGGAGLLEALTSGALPAGKAVDEFNYACAEAQWSALRASVPEIGELARLDRHKLVARFRELELERIRTSKNAVLANHYKRVPRGSTGEMGLVRGEIGRKRGHKSVRWLMKHAGTALQRIKPVMLMSPYPLPPSFPWQRDLRPSCHRRGVAGAPAGRARCHSPCLADCRGR